MAKTLIDLGRQAVARIFVFGSTASGGQSSVTLYNGTAASSNVNLDVRGSAEIGGNLSVAGDLNITGAINQQTVNNLNVKDKTITLNDGGAAGSAGGSGLEIEAGAATVGAIRFDSAAATKFTVGDGTTQRALVDDTTAQTLSNKTLAAPTLTGTPTAPTAGAGTNNTQVATTGFVQQELAALGATSGYFRATAISGTQDGTNKTFTLAQGVAADSEQVFFNGQLLTPGSSNDYVISGTTITFQAAFDAPVAGDVLRVYGVR